MITNKTERDNKTIKNLGDGDFSYRGFTFMRDDKIRGYSGHYRLTAYSRRTGSLSSDTRRELIRKIDDLLDTLAAEADVVAPVVTTQAPEPKPTLVNEDTSVKTQNDFIATNGDYFAMYIKTGLRIGCKDVCAFDLPSSHPRYNDVLYVSDAGLEALFDNMYATAVLDVIGGVT